MLFPMMKKCTPQPIISDQTNEIRQGHSFSSEELNRLAALVSILIEIDQKNKIRPLKKGVKLYEEQP